MDEMSAEDLLAAARGRLSMRDLSVEAGAKTPQPKDRLTMSFSDLYTSNSKNSPKRRSLQVPGRSSRSNSPKPKNLQFSPKASPVVNHGSSLEASFHLDDNEEEEAEEEDGGEEKKEVDNISHVSEVSDEEEDEEEEEEDEDDVNHLLEAVRGRMEQQRFMDEVKELKRQLEQKDEEITKLRGQLQMAISTKQSLLIANSELEQRHMQDMEMSTRFEEDLRTAGRLAMDIRAEIEKDFMNDLALMAQRLAVAEQNLSDREDKICLLETQILKNKIISERHVCTDCTEKAEIIAALQEKVHKLERVAPRQETNKVKFYRAKLGL